MKNWIYIFFLMFISCTERADFEIDYKNQLVLDLLLSVDSSISFNPKQTSELNSKCENCYLTDLLFFLYEDGIIVDTIGYSNYDSSFKSNIEVGYGRNYKIYCQFNGETVVSTTQIPDRVSIDNINITPIAYRNSRDWPYNQVILELNDLPGENYYMIFVKSQTYLNDIYYSPNFPDSLYEDKIINSHLRSIDPVILGEPYFPLTVQDEQKTFPYLVFSDKLFDGQSYKIQFFYESPLYTGGKGIFMYDHVPEINLLNIHPDLYEYLSTYIQHIDNRIGNILSGRLEPLNVYTNIENGMGIFSSFSRSIDTSVFLERTDVETGSIIVE